MEEFKSFDEINEIDERHQLLGRLTGRTLDLKKLHLHLSTIEMNETVPEEIVGQFNIAKNMALYSYYCYSLAPEVRLKTYTVIEYALKKKIGSKKTIGLKKLLKEAVKNNWIVDSGFRHISSPSESNEYCESLIEVLPSLRNDSAHGTTMLSPDFITHIEICADLVNQLFQLKKES